MNKVDILLIVMYKKKSADVTLNKEKNRYINVSFIFLCIAHYGDCHSFRQLFYISYSKIFV